MLRNLLIVIALYGASTAVAIESKDAKTRNIMNTVLDSLTKLLPHTLDPFAFRDEKNQQEIQHNLELLSKNIDLLEAHSKNYEPGFQMVAQSLNDEIHDALLRFKHHRYKESIFIVQNMTENCIACHSRYPSKDYPSAERFLKRVAMDNLPTEQKARLYVITRQFDKALATYEKDLLIDPSDLLFLAHLKSYLTVAIRVKSDLARAQKLMENTLKAKKISAHVSYVVNSWLRSIKNIDPKRLVGKPQMEYARYLITKGQGSMEYPNSPKGFVYFLAASSILHQFLAGKKLNTKENSEVFFYLGITEMLTGRSFWVSQTPGYFELAIRNNPHAAYAKKAYALLEEEILNDYSGSGGIFLPNEVSDKLQELKKMVDKP